jgi:hypothetical protein
MSDTWDKPATLATDEDLDRIFGPERLHIGFPVRPAPPSADEMQGAPPEPADDKQL